MALGVFWLSVVSRGRPGKDLRCVVPVGGGAVSRGADDARSTTAQCATCPAGCPCGRCGEGVLKLAPNPPPPPKRGLSVPYGSYSNIHVVQKHFRGQVATGQHWKGHVNVCPWSKLEGALHCPWWACRHLRPNHLNLRDLIHHLAKDHRSDPSHREPTEAMITGVMPRGLMGPFATAQAWHLTVTQPSGVQSSGAQEASLSAAFSSARGSVVVLSTVGKGSDPGAARSGTARASSAPSGAHPVAASWRGARQGSA